MRLKDKVAIVTGATSGIGAATAARFVEEGALTLGVGRSDRWETPEGPRFAPLRIDLTGEGAAEAIFARCRERFGEPDILVNNAGIGNARPILETSDADLERYLMTNLKAPFALCRLAVASMQARGGGAIVNVSSGYALAGAAYSAAYSTSKAALIGLSRSLAAEYGRDGIRTNVVAPATTTTPINADRIRNDPWLYDMWMTTNPVGRPGRPREIADAILFLASDEASFVNGVVLPVDGGWSATKVAPRPREPGVPA